jgi:hypothetical protein
LSKKKKKPRLQKGLLSALEQSRRQPRIAASPDTEDERPVWLLRRMEMDGTWGWTATSRPHLLKLWERLRQLELLTWKEIRNQPHNHPMPFERICAEAQKRLEALDLDDAVDVLYQLHVGKTERLWGIRNGREFLALWWDPDHTVYPMELPNT